MIEPVQVELYQTPDGEFPYEHWFDRLKDKGTKSKIEARITRLRTGNWGRWKAVGDGVREIAIDFGPGYRIYAGQVDSNTVLLLCAGDKATQVRDISTAKQHWAEFKSSSRKDTQCEERKATKSTY